VQKWPTVTELMNASSQNDGSDLSFFAVCTMCGEIGQIEQKCEGRLVSLVQRSPVSWAAVANSS